MNKDEWRALQCFNVSVKQDPVMNKVNINMGFDYWTAEVAGIYTSPDEPFGDTAGPTPWSNKKHHESKFSLSFSSEHMQFIDVAGPVRAGARQAFMQAHGVTPSPELVDALFRMVCDAAMANGIVINQQEIKVSFDFNQVSQPGSIKFGVAGRSPIERLDVACPALSTQVEYPREIVEQDEDYRDKATALRYVIMDLNDLFKWPRERIADWLESLDLDITVKMEEL